MTVVVSDLVARVSAVGTQQAVQDVKSFGEAAAATAAQVQRAYELMAQAAVKQGAGGTVADWVKQFQSANVQPNAAALADAAKSMQQTSAAATATVGPTQAVARAAAEHAAATRTGAQAAQAVSEGWKLSESSVVRFGAALVGVNLGISLIAGAARVIHDAIESTITAQLDWERSLKTLSGLYGDVGAQVAAIATAQANLPGVLGTQQEFAQAAINASVLTQRYGINPDQVNQLITTGGRVAYATGMTEQADRERLQGQILAAVQSGAPLPAQYGIYTDPEAVARRLGFRGGQALQAFTPQEVMQARGAIVSQGLSAFADRAGANQRAALDAVTAAERAQEQARTAVQNTLEASGGRDAATGLPMIGGIPIVPEGGGYGAAMAADNYRQAQQQQAAANLSLPDVNAENRVIQANQEYVRALADSKKVQEDSRRALEDLSKSADAAGAQLLDFTGSLEDSTSIAHAQLLAQAQATVTGLARSAVPTFGMQAPEISAIGRGTAWQDALQNYFATLAQGQNANPIQRYLEQQANTAGPGLEAQRGAAQRALAQGPQLTGVETAIGQSQTQAAQADIAAAERQAELDRISLDQRQRYVQLMRDTLDLRLLDNAQQQRGIEASMALTRAQQAALPAQYRASDAQYQQNLAQAQAQQRMGRLLQGQDVSDLPTLDELINRNYQAQLAGAENAPDLVRAQRGVELSQRPLTQAGLDQSLTEAKIHLAELANDARNLQDIPAQTVHELELIQINRDQIGLQTEMRELLKALVWYMSQPPAAGAGVPGTGGSSAPPAPPDLPGNRRGPF